MQADSFQVDVDDGVAIVTFDRPPVNAQDRQSREELTYVFDTLSDRPDVRAVILTGAGHVFSAGADIAERVTMEAAAGDYIRHNRLTRECFYSITDCSKPVIAALNGPAIGAGFAIALSCDIIVAAEDAYAQMPEIDVGLAGGAKFLEVFPRYWARYLFFTGRRASASELYRLGIAQSVVPRGELMPVALEIGRELATKSPLVMARIKHSFNTAESMPHRDGYRFEQTVTLELSRTDDAREAQRAFLEKRKAAFGQPQRNAGTR